ncbi:MAG: LLM class flavin-dependent oxidoreductase [Actinomycetia bacterium]|nr:LLM class flavin-dependent oxidoreductase [Actinomycetes bacterium]
MAIPLSVNLMPEAPVRDLVELARLAEARGCTRCWVYDEGLVTRDVYITLAAIAEGTETIGLGPGITNPHVRHPGATAAAIATLDEYSGGRAFLGLGAGGGLTLRPLGIDPARPFTAVKETVDAIRGLFSGATIDHDGEFALRQARLDYARSDIEIFLAGRGSRMMGLAGERADGFYLSYTHKDLLGSAIEGIRARRPPSASPFLVTYSTMIANTEADLETARSHLTYRLVDSPPEVKDLIGMDADDTEAIAAALAAGGPRGAAHLVKEEWVPHFVIAGTPRQTATELHQLMTTNGIDEFQVPVLEIEGAAELIERTAALF